ncbi:MAG: hypothetical protein JST53_15455 [Actinobacteria bacterium]|nr:hypothetical protein [Actinomycetota bacterium]
MSPRAVLALIAVVLAAAVTGCGGSSGSGTVGSGNEAFTVPSNVHGLYGELGAILEQLPYRAWYSQCVITEVKKTLGPKEAEELEELPEEERERKAVEVISGAGPACEARHHLPVIDVHASTKELSLLRAGYVTSFVALAEAGGADRDQASCVESQIEHLPEKKVIAIGNGTKQVRKGILLSIFKPCTSDN